MNLDHSPSVQATREKLEQGLLAKFGEAYEQAAKQAQAIADPARRALGAARIALEHAVLQTAIEKDMPTKAVAAMLEKASPQQVAHFIRQGKASIERNYGVDGGAMVAALSAHVANVDLPRGLAQTEAVRQLVERGRELVHTSMAEAYQTRGRFAPDAPRAEGIQLQESGRQLTAREQLKNHMVFIESAVNHAVGAGRLNPEQASMLKERIEHQVFHTPADAKLSAQFKSFHDSVGPGLRAETMREARRITTDKTVAEIAQALQDARERLQRLRPAHDRA